MTQRLWVNNVAAKRPPSVCQRVPLGRTAGANGPLVDARGEAEPHTRSPLLKKMKTNNHSVHQHTGAMDAPLAY